MKSPEQAESERVASELKGNTLRVYWYVMNANKQTVGVREVQRALNFSSPTLALYHLDKLKDLGLVSKDTGEYRLIKEVKVDVLKQFLRLGECSYQDSPFTPPYSPDYSVIICTSSPT